MVNNGRNLLVVTMATNDVYWVNEYFGEPVDRKSFRRFLKMAHRVISPYYPDAVPSCVNVGKFRIPIGAPPEVCETMFVGLENIIRCYPKLGKFQYFPNIDSEILRMFRKCLWVFYGERAIFIGEPYRGGV